MCIAVDECGYADSAKIDGHVCHGVMFNPGLSLNHEVPFMQQTEPLLGTKISLCMW